MRLHFDCTIAAMEAAGLGNYENRHKDWEGFKHTADAVGIKECKSWVLPEGERKDIIRHGFASVESKRRFREATLRPVTAREAI